MASTSAQGFVCPRCRTTFAQASNYCSACGAEMVRREPRPSTEGFEAIADRRLTDSNRAWLGKIVDNRYRVLEVIGRGGMGIVYRVEHLRMGKLAAMKVLHRDLLQDADVQRRFETEAAAISRLHHPHTVQVFDFGTAHGNLYLIMELVRGLDLGRVISRDGPMPWARAAPLFIQMCGALQEAHELGIVHRDLKPENVLITRTTGGRDYAKVLDFGLAKLDQRGGATETTDKQSIVGTPYFMAPEQIRGDAIDARTDLYSFGALMFEVLTATHLYSGSTAVGVLTKHLTAEPDAPSMRAPNMGIPPAVDYLCRKALARDPSQRWQSAAELADAIEEVYAETVEGTGSRSALSRGLRGGRLVTDTDDQSDVRLRRSDIDAFERSLKRRRFFVLGATSAVVLGGAGAAAWMLTREPTASRTEIEPNDDPAAATLIAPGTEVSGFLGKRVSPHEGDRDVFVVRWPAGSRRTISVRVTAPPNIDVHLSLTDGVRTASADEGGVGEPELLLRRGVDGPVYITVAQTLGQGESLPVENVSDPYTLTVVEETTPGESEPNGNDADATLLVLGQELHGYLDTRTDVDVLRWTGDTGAYHVVVRADGLPLAWRIEDGEPRTPGAARVELSRGAMLRFERTDRGGAGSLPGRDVAWSILVTE